MFGQCRARRHPPQLLQLAQRLTEVVELGAEVVTQLLGRPADVVTRLAQRARGPADGAGQPLGPEDHQPGDHQDQPLAPADVGEHYVLLSEPGFTVSVTCLPSRTTSIGASWPIFNSRTAT